MTIASYLLSGMLPTKNLGQNSSNPNQRVAKPGLGCLTLGPQYSTLIQTLLPLPFATVVAFFT